MTGDDIRAILGLALVVALFGGMVISRAASKRRIKIVTEQSAALAAVRELNELHGPRQTYPAPIRYEWQDSVDSKAKFDRYDLKQLFLNQIAIHESTLDRQIADHVAAMNVYAEYVAAYEDIRAKFLGRTVSEALEPDSFTDIEEKLFADMRLRESGGDAMVTCIVRYTSPQGQNAYERSDFWTLRGLQHGLATMRRARETRSTTSYLRQQERNRMSADLRFQVLKRDNYRCRGCGATAATEALHVDHIFPISKGGKTVLSNLQTLCRTCNLGKSDRH